MFRGSLSVGRASVLTVSLFMACAVETQSHEQIPVDPFGGSSGSGGSGVEASAGTSSGGTPGVSGSVPSGSGGGGTPAVGGMFGGGAPGVGGASTAGAGGSATGGHAGAGGSAGAGGNSGAGGMPAKTCGTERLTIASCTAQSEDGASHAAALACDGNATSRWSSAYSEPQWIWFDLAQVAHVGRVLIKWESAYATSYRLEVADNSGGPWMQVSTQDAANGGTDDVTNLDANGRYVRMFGLTRDTQYGFSIFELEVYGDLDENCN